MKERNKYLAIVIISIILMFALIFLTVGLTGEREMSDFNDKDKIIFAVFAVVEIAVIICGFYYGVKLGKLVQKQSGTPKAEIKSKQGSILHRRGIIVFVMSAVSCTAVSVLGMLFEKKTQYYWGPAVYILLAIFGIMPPLFTVVSVVLKNRREKELEEARYADMQRILMEQREDVESSSRRLRLELKRLRLISVFITCALFVVAGCLSFIHGIMTIVEGDDSTGLLIILFYAIIIACIGFVRIPREMPTGFIDDDECYIPEEDIPYIYALVRRVAEEMGCRGKIRIAVKTDGNLGVARIGKTISLEMGIYLLSVFSEEELCTVLYHEFSHILDDEGKKEDDYGTWLSGGQSHSFALIFANLLFGYVDLLYQFKLMLFRYAVSVNKESEADRAMQGKSSSAIIASALLKTHFYTLFLWESVANDFEPYCAPETPSMNIVSDRINEFKKCISLRKKAWLEYVDKEIMSRSASHPTISMRLGALGINEYTIFNDQGSQEYKKDVKTVSDYLAGLFYEKISPDYEIIRKNEYLDPLESICGWEKKGKPIIAEEYRTIVEDMMQVGRISDAEKVCDRAIESLSDIASAYAFFIKGSVLIHRFDPSGIEFIYHALENNQNYTEKGLDEIGAFCCISGNQEELDRYREVSVNMLQNKKDVYDKASFISKDDLLRPEHLPDGMLDEILRYFRSVDKLHNSCVDRIYLVRKIITDDFFASVFIISFDSCTEEEAEEKVMDSFFNYLDTFSDWQFALFDQNDASDIDLESIPGSLVYQRTEIV